MTVLELITKTLLLLGVTQPGEGPSPEEAADALESLNDLLASWNNEGLCIYQIEHGAYALVPGQQVYFIGTSDPTSATDLVVSHTDNKKVSSATYRFQSSDVGGWINVTGGSGWTTGYYAILSVVAGVATLSGSPAVIDHTGGQFTGSRGSAADFVADRPQRIVKASAIVSDLSLPVEVLRSAKDWFAIPDKSATGKAPTKLYYDRAYPIGSIYVWPILAALQTATLELLTWHILGAFGDLYDDVMLPPGYERALRYNLAVDLAPEYGVEPKQAVVLRAQESKAAIQRLNIAAHEEEMADELPPTPQPVAPPAAPGSVTQ